MAHWFAQLFGSPGTESLPPRIRDAILRQQDQSEILIGWVQLAVVSTFTILFLVAPTPAPGMLGFDLVPFVLAVYMVFTILRLFAAYRGPLAPWLLALSVVADMVLLMTTIWSFHIKYGQPPTFYLKAPTLLYVFIFIALRALRFEARFVLLAGVTAALGWLVLVAYAAAHAEGTITRDFVHYMTRNAILLGAEFDKIISILVVTLILAVAIARARIMLIGAVVKETEARDLSRFFDAHVARQITGSETEIQPGQGVTREAAVLMLDIRGFTALAAELEPADLMALLSDYQSRVVPIIQDAGGSIDKFMGDGIMATFGAARASRHPAAEALAAVDGVLAEASRWNRERAGQGRFPVPIGAAVATGPILFGAVGDDTRLEYTVIGEAVNMAAKLEKQNKEEGTAALTDIASYELAKRQGYRPLSDHELRRGRRIEGMAGSHDLVVLAAAENGDDGPGTDPAPADPHTPRR